MFYHMKTNAIDNDTIKEETHRWYIKDKTITTQKEILLFIKLFTDSSIPSAGTGCGPAFFENYLPPS